MYITHPDAGCKYHVMCVLFLGSHWTCLFLVATPNSYLRRNKVVNRDRYYCARSTLVSSGLLTSTTSIYHIIIAHLPLSRRRTGLKGYLVRLKGQLRGLLTILLGPGSVFCSISYLVHNVTRHLLRPTPGFSTSSSGMARSV